jgi:hypothetical protein
MVFLALLGVFLGFTLFNVGGTIPDTGLGDVVTAPPKSASLRATLSVTRISPLTVSGRGFKSGERVTVSMNAMRKKVIATRTGTFNLRLGGTGRCNGATVAAVGSKGSRAVVNFSQLLCVSP